MKVRFAFLLVMVGFIATVGSCSNRPLNPLNPCTINGVVQNVPVNPQRALDVLFIIDDSPSMLEEQSKLALQVPRLVNLLLTGGIDVNMSTPVGEFPAVESLHVGIVTPDLGHSTEPPHGFTPGVHFTPTSLCERNNGNGKAGFMQVAGLIDDDDNPSTPRVMCDAQTPPADTFYLDRPTGASMSFDVQFVDDVECVTGQPADFISVGGGCGFEQQLEAILAQDRNGANAGFSRQDALLAVILITDEDDCSTTDPRIFDTVPNPGNEFQGPFTTNDEVQFNLRCYEHGTKEGRPSDPLQSIERYVQGIAALKDDPSQVVFAAITGIPEDPDLDGPFPTDVDRYDAILAHPGMEEIPDPASADTQTQQLRPACGAGSADGAAAPGRRVVEVAKGLAEANNGVGTVVESICASDYAPALNAIVERIADALRRLCLPRPLNRNSEDLVGCEVREVQPEGATCADAAGREPEAVANEDGREVCRVIQLPSNPATGVPAGLGWFYDDFTQDTMDACFFNDDKQRVRFTEDAEPESGTRIRFECLQTAPPQDVDVGWPCAIDADCERSAESLDEQYDRDNLSLVCDELDTNTCQLFCTGNAECPGGFSCFDADGDGPAESYCVNPTCTLN
ncbi:MAG: hypothetical protein OES69_10475 [Myxococcales bacterium]|nr:hypothetical protein [Myxococcales bacterium]MDH3844353.1 hypothetical protein [Myxococcales bacterium]